MYAGHVDLVEYAPCTLLRLEKRWDRHEDKRQTDVRQTDALCLRLDMVLITIGLAMQHAAMGLMRYIVAEQFGVVYTA